MAPEKSSLSKPLTSYSTGPLAGTPPIPWDGGVSSACLSSKAGCCCARLFGERPPACERAWPCGACPCTLRLRPTVGLDVMSLVASSCKYNRGASEPRMAQACTAHVAAHQRGLAACPQPCHPPALSPSRPCGSAMAGVHGCPRGGAPSRQPSVLRDNPRGAHGRSSDPIASPCLVMRGPTVSPLFASSQWLLPPGCSSEALDRTGHERNRWDTVGLQQARHNFVPAKPGADDCSQGWEEKG
jgi:hypothetical protein